MSYMHIENLYKAREILEFKTCYALEKIHGTSAHVAYRDGVLRLSSGGESAERFAKLFDREKLSTAFAAKFTPLDPVTVYGEAYGGKQQGMSKTYGAELKFIAFEVKVGDVFLSVPKAFTLATDLGFEFVDYVCIETNMDAINEQRDRPSTQAARNGIMEPKLREGVVLRPPFEVVTNNGRRIIAKHKREEFSERGTPKFEDLDPTRRMILEKAEAIADEWVTPMRLSHVIDRLISEREDKDVSMKDTPVLIVLMNEDVTREASGEIVGSPEVRKHIGQKTVKLLKERLSAILR